MICGTCGTTSSDGVRFCTNCGSPAAPQAAYAAVAAPQQSIPGAYAPAPPIPSAYGVPPQPGHYYPPPVAGPRYANFFARFFALLIDEALAGALAAGVYGVMAFVGYLLAVVGFVSHYPWGTVLIVILTWGLGVPLAVAAYVMYFVKQETSANQATLGKRMLGMRIVNMTGGTISIGQSLGRFLVKNLISDFFFGIGFFMAAFTERKQALHDMAASTLVIEAR